MEDSRLVRIEDNIHEIKLILVRQEEHLKEHMRRSLANETAVDILKQEQQPIKELVIKVKFIHTLILWIGGLVGLAHTVMKILEFKR
jgi:hypothetical protein